MANDLEKALKLTGYKEEKPENDTSDTDCITVSNVSNVLNVSPIKEKETSETTCTHVLNVPNVLNVPLKEEENSTDSTNSTNSTQVQPFDQAIREEITYNDKKKGELAYIVFTNPPKTKTELSVEFEISSETVKKTISRQDTIFKLGEGKVVLLTSLGKRFIEDCIKKVEENNKPSYLEQRDKLIETTKDVIDSFVMDGVYNKQLLRDCSDSNPKPFVEIDFNNLKEYSPQLATTLTEEPTETKELFLESLKEKLFSKKDLIFTNLSCPSVHIGDIRSKHQNQLIRVEGDIILKGEARIRAIQTSFECPSCGTVITIKQDSTKLKEPVRCSCGRKGKFRLIKQEEEDEQRMILKEPYDLVNRETEKINICLRGSLVGKEYERLRSIGERVLVTGVIGHAPKEIKGGVSTELTRFLYVWNIEPTNNNIDIKLTEEDVKQILEFAKDNPLDKIKSSVFQNIYGLEEVKEGILLQQFGGVRKVMSGKTVRGDIHILNIGDPGTCKSDLNQVVEKLSIKSQSTSGPGSSGVGLIGCAKYDDYLKDWVFEGGALPKANKGIVLMDEFDKINELDRQYLHTAMEQQVVNIDKGTVHAKVITQTSLLANANPKDSSWNLNKDLISQIEMPTSLHGRFDLIFAIKDISNEERDSAIADQILTLNNDEIDYTFYKKYIIYAKTINPVMSEELKQLLKDLYIEIRKINQSHQSTITPRDINALIRLSEASARSRLSETVTKEDLERAVKLHRYCLNELGIFEETEKEVIKK